MKVLQSSTVCITVICLASLGLHLTADPAVTPTSGTNNESQTPLELANKNDSSSTAQTTSAAPTISNGTTPEPSGNKASDTTKRPDTTTTATPTTTVNSTTITTTNSSTTISTIATVPPNKTVTTTPTTTQATTPTKNGSTTTEAGSSTTMSSSSSVNSPTTPQTPIDGKSTPAKIISTTTAPRKFDGLSFIGGMILALGLFVFIVIGWKCYQAKYGNNRNYRTL